MKKLMILIALMIGQFALADSTTGNMKDEDTKELVNMLKGHTLKCDSMHNSKRSNIAKGFFPFTLKATQLKKGDVKVEVACHDSKMSWGVGGQDLTYTFVNGWLMLESGDDGRQYSFIRLGSYDDVMDCSEMRAFDKAAPDIQGVVMSEWSVIRAVEHIYCCYE